MPAQEEQLRAPATKRQRTAAGSPTADNSNHSTTSNYQQTSAEEVNDQILQIINYFSVRDWEEVKDDPVVNRLRQAPVFISDLALLIKQRLAAKREQTRAEKEIVPGPETRAEDPPYLETLLTPYGQRDEEEYRQRVGELLQHDLNSLREIFSRGQLTRPPHEYQICLYKLLVEFMQTGKAHQQEFCWGLLDWLAPCQVEEILQEKLKMKLLPFLVLKNNLVAVEWAFQHYNQQQIEEAFNDEEENDLFSCAIDEGLRVEITELIFRKLAESLSGKEAEERTAKINSKKEQIRNELEAREELGEGEDWVLWQQLEEKLALAI